MFAHVSVGVSDMDRAVRFYDTVLAVLGHERLFEDKGEHGHHVAWGSRAAQFIVNTPLDPSRPAGPANGSHICFSARSKEEVDAFHVAALAQGGRDAGAPGFRPHYAPDYYAAFALDLDGHKIEAVARVRPEDLLEQGR